MLLPSFYNKHSEGSKVINKHLTGAGPQDIINQYKADQLARQSIWGNKKHNILHTLVIMTTIMVVTKMMKPTVIALIFHCRYSFWYFVGWTSGDRKIYWKITFTFFI